MFIWIVLAEALRAPLALTKLRLGSRARAAPERQSESFLRHMVHGNVGLRFGGGLEECQLSRNDPADAWGLRFGSIVAN